MKALSDNALRDIIRKINALMDEQFLEALFQVATGEAFTTDGVLDEIKKLRDAGRLSVETIPPDRTVASRVLWPERWGITAPVYWPVALDGWMTALKVHDAAGLDKWLHKKAKKAAKNLKLHRVLTVAPDRGGSLVWSVEKQTSSNEINQDKRAESAAKRP